MRLLLVEDEVDIQSFLRRSLEEAGYEVEAANDGKSAERLAVESTFDILIVDLGLPDQDGITLILRLRHSAFALRFLFSLPGAPLTIVCWGSNRAVTII